MKKRKVASFRKGQVVYCSGNAVLVTGAGDKSQGYPVFAGTVIMAVKREDDEVWPLGMHSDTWSTEAFRKININLSKFLQESLAF